MRNEHRERAITEIVNRITTRYLSPVHGDNQRTRVESIIELINETLYEEKKRLKTEPIGSPLRQDDIAFWQQIQKGLADANDRELKAMLMEITRRFAHEVAGNFNPRVYQLSVKAVPVGLSLLLNAVSVRRMLRNFPQSLGIENNIHISGEVGLLQQLEKKGTLILVPTHLSNLDSPVIGWSIYKMGLPPFTYGAGLNLFHNRFLSFFMHNLGAYRVDRRKKAQIYKEILKEYATCSLEFGYNNLFFPGGTRNRLGEVERELKKGLLGTSIQAYTHNLQNKKPNPNFYIAPCTINYHLVLEARTLIEDALKEQGKRRYIIDDDEFSDLRKLYRFGTNLATLNAQIQIVIGQIYDPFGNRVDGSGQSYDQRDRPIDITRYVTRNGQPVVDLQRDREYTNEVSSRIVEQFSRNNMIMTTHIMAYTCFQLLRQKNPDMDLYRLLHTGGFVDQLSVLEVCHATEQNLQRLKQLEAANQIRLEPTLHRQAVEDIVSSGLQFFNSYHTKPAIHRQGDWILSGDLPLLYYYNNRLNGYPING